MKKYKLKRNKWTMWVLPGMIVLFFGLVAVSVLLGDYFTTEPTLPDFKPAIDSHIP